MSIRISVLGDFCPIGRLDNERNMHSDLWLGELREHIRNADFTIANLECPLYNGDGKICKSGPHLKARQQMAEAIAKAGIGIVTLANNHIMDYGAEGLKSTLEALDKHGIRYVGVGSNLVEARKPLVISKDDISLAIVNICEREFSIAGDNKSGAAPLNLIDNFYAIENAKSVADHVILIIHGGMENYPHPTPNQVMRYRFFASLGVTAVVGHHSHCVQDHEIFRGVPIIYSLGNFMFDEPGNPLSWYNGTMLTLEIGDGMSGIDFNLVAFHNGNPEENGMVVIRNDKIAGQSVIKQNAADEESDFVQRMNMHWAEQVQKRIFDTYKAIYRPNKIIRLLLKLGFYKVLVKKKFNRQLLNLLRCDTHYERCLSVLESIAEI